MRAETAPRERLQRGDLIFPAVAVIYCLLVTSLDGPRLLPCAFGAASLLLLGMNARVRSLVRSITPYLLFVLAYDAVRYGRQFLFSAERTNSCAMQVLDRRLFGFGTGVSPSEFVASHHAPFLDLFFAIPYFIFVYLVLGYALYLFRTDRPRMERYLWAFAVTNALGFCLWFALPTAPPWYVASHGCLVDAAAAPSAGALTRVDQLLGIGYFHFFYGRSVYVFGAMPSLHCAYPMVGLLTAWPHVKTSGRLAHILYATSMFLASVYLLHHWVVDGLVGFVVAALSVALVSRLLPDRSEGLRPLAPL